MSFPLPGLDYWLGFDIREEPDPLRPHDCACDRLPDTDMDDLPFVGECGACELAIADHERHRSLTRPRG